MSDTFTAPERFRTELRDALLAHPATRRRAAPAPVGRRRLVRIGAGAAVALGGAVLAIVLALDSGGELAPQRASAASVLTASATALERTGAPLMLRRGDFFYTKLALWWRYPSSARRSYVVRSVDEEWVARDGAGRSRTRMLRSGRNARSGRSQVVSLRASARPFILESGLTLSYDQLRALPADPVRLAAAIDRLASVQMRRYAPLAKLFPKAQWHTVVTFSAVRGLADTPASPGVRAALYRVLASTPGIRLLGRRTDSAGRTGTAVAATLGAFNFTLIIDPSTGTLLQTTRTLLHRSTQDPGQPPGLVNRATFLSSAVVRSTHSAPR
jgi:hypothetical protein